MSTASSIFGLMTFAGLTWLAHSIPAASSILNPEAEGKEMAERLRDARPTEPSEIHGTLELTVRGGSPRSIPITSEIRLTSTNWHVIYRTEGEGSSAETLTIVHRPGQTNLYIRTVGGVAGTPGLTEPFAGSDFWVQDLGQEFFQWPTQRALRAEMSRSRPCRVLESIHPRPDPAGYSRVLSWVDNETGGLLKAEAYDAKGKLLKKFSLGSLEKVAGRYQVRDMSIRNLQADQQTELRFRHQAGAGATPAPP